MKWFCPNCEVQMAAKHYVEMNEDGKGFTLWLVDCSMCSLALKVQVITPPTKDYDQVTEDFNKIPLTDSQRGTKRHSSIKKS